MQNCNCADPKSCNNPEHSKSQRAFKEFVHIHLHTSQSTLDGCGKVQKYIELAKEYGHTAMSITDHGNPAGLFDFYREIKNAGMKPILGEEFYFTTNLANRVPNKQRPLEEKDKHQTVLIKNAEGYKNFCKLTYLSFTEGFYYKPRIEYDMLFQHKKGLILTSGCAASMFNQLVANGKAKEAEEWFKKFVNEFGEDFYGEIQFNEITDKAKFGIDQKEMNDFIIKMCQKYGTKILIGGDVHYAGKDDARLQDIVINCQRRKTATTESTENQESFIHARHLFYQSSNDFFEFNEKFGYNYPEKLIEEAFQNSIDLKNKVNFEFETGKINFPKYQHETIKNKTSDEILETLAEEGLFKKLKTRIDRGEELSNDTITKYQERLAMELDVIKQKKIADYFLIVQDVINWAKSQGIEVGVARGSVGGSLAAYAIGITGIDSMKFGLYFERFINPERTAMPDIDCDFMNGAREKVREYLENKYGKESVFGVVTFHVYKAKSALQDASRGLGKDTSFGSTLMREITNLEVQLPRDRDRKEPASGDEEEKVEVHERHTPIEEAKDLKKFFEAVEKDSKTTPTVHQWINENQTTIEQADKLMGQVKNLGTHAGGILITPGPVYNHIPVTRGSGEIVTAFKEADGSSKDLSELGLLKLDILGLRTLNVIKGCIDQIKSDLNIDISQDIEHVALEDPKLFETINKGNLYGIFQLDGGAMDLIKMIRPTCFEDIAAINALNRPGPKETFGLVYGKWKRYWQEGDPDKCKEDLDRYPRLDFMIDVTKETYGCMCYQEHFMLMVREAAGFNMGEADNFRRAIAWREDNPKYHTVKKYFDKLADSMKSKGYSQDDVDYFVEYCRKFMGYSFNKAHAVAYAYIAMQTLYLKVNYPAYFYANLLNVESHDAYQEIISDAIANGIKILSPSITKSKYDFVVENNAVRIGLKALKGFGESAYLELEGFEVGSKHKEIYEILNLPFKKVNSKSFDVLVDAGTFDEFGIEREKIHLVRALYKDKKIEKWFTRKRKPLEIETMPDCLLQFPESTVMDIAKVAFALKEGQGVELVTRLIPFIKVDKKLTEFQKTEREEEILGFSLGLAEKLSQLITLADRYPELKLKSLTSYQTEKDLCYWYLIKKTTAKTKTGKPYLILEISDKSTTVKAKCWNMVDVQKGKAYVSHLKKDKYGYSIVTDSYLTEVEL